MSMTSGGVSTNDPKPIPAVAAPAGSQPAARRGFGSLQSMVISMVVILAAVLAWVAMVPRVREVNQPAVDVTSVATQVRRDSGWAISAPRLPTGWKATSVRFAPVAGGVRTWHAGYLSPDGFYVSIDQTEMVGASGVWVDALTSNGQADGSLSAAGKTWRKLSSRSILQHSLVHTGPGASAGSVPSTGSGKPATGTREVATVLSGTAPYVQLARFAETLEPVRAEQAVPAKPAG